MKIVHFVNILEKLHKNIYINKWLTSPYVVLNILMVTNVSVIVILSHDVGTKVHYHLRGIRRIVPLYGISLSWMSL